MNQMPDETAKMGIGGRIALWLGGIVFAALFVWLVLPLLIWVGAVVLGCWFLAVCGQSLQTGMENARPPGRNERRHYHYHYRR